MRLLAIIYALLTLGCSRGQYVGLPSSKTDTLVVPAGTAIGKLKARTVILQTGTGNVASTTDNTKAGSRGGSAATAPNASASTTTKKAGVPWWVFLLVGVASIVGWEWLTHQFSLTAWLPWRVKPG